MVNQPHSVRPDLRGKNSISTSSLQRLEQELAIDHAYPFDRLAKFHKRLSEHDYGCDPGLDLEQALGFVPQPVAVLEGLGYPVTVKKREPASLAGSSAPHMGVAALPHRQI